MGTTVLVHGKGTAFGVEFVGCDRHTVGLLALERTDVRPVRAGDILHARELASA
jgi:hypothetical protein